MPSQKYICWDTETSDQEDGHEVETIYGPDGAAEEYSAWHDRQWCDYSEEREIAVTIPDEDKKEGEVWPKKYKVYLESQPTYHASEVET